MIKHIYIITVLFITISACRDKVNEKKREVNSSIDSSVASSDNANKLIGKWKLINWKIGTPFPFMLSIRDKNYWYEDRIFEFEFDEKEMYIYDANTRHVFNSYQYYLSDTLNSYSNNRIISFHVGCLFEEVELFSLDSSTMKVRSKADYFDTLIFVRE